MNYQEIHDLKEYLVDDYHGQRITEQIEDQTFADGSFTKKLAKDLRVLYTPSTGARMISKPAAHLITSNPQFFRWPRKLPEVDSASRVAKLGNHWISQLKRQNPNPFPQDVKTNMKRGERWIRLTLNEKWTADNQDGMPVWFTIPEPMVIFGSPNEHNGIPEELIVFYERSVADIQKVWPDFTPKGNNKRVKWLEYWSAKERYYEADDEPVLDIQPNVLGFVPFVHAYSGFGDESPEMKPELLAVGVLRYVRDLLAEECALRSDIRSGIHRHVFKPIVLKNNTGADLSKDELSEIDMGPLSVIVLPQGIDWVEPPNYMPQQEVFQYLANVQAEIRAVMSPVFEGGSFSSGRNRALTKADEMKPFDTIIQGSENSWGTAFGLALRILDTVHNMMPITVRSTVIEKGTSLRKEEIVTKEDIGGYYDCEIKMKSVDPVEQDRTATLHAKYFLDGLIDAETCLIEGFGKTQAEAKTILKKIMIDQVTIKSPQFAQMVGFQLAQESGMMRQFMEATQMGGTTGGTTVPSPRQDETKTPTGRDMIESLALTERGGRERQGNAL